MKSKPLPSRHELNNLFRYEPDTGKLFWQRRDGYRFSGLHREASAKKWNNRFAGKEIETALPSGHLYTSIWARKFLVHRIIWKMVHGVDAEDIDHINGDSSDNRLVNLRDVSHQENGRNMRLRKNNTSGVMGVYWSKPHEKWCARINVDYRTIYLGLFDQFDEAVLTRRAAEAQYGFHPNHGRAS